MLYALDAVFVSHLHYDHLDYPSLERLGRSVPVVVPRGAGRLLRRRRFEQVVEVESGQEVRLGPIVMDPLVEMQGNTPAPTSEEIDRLRLRYGFWIIIIGFSLVFLITLIATFRWAEVTSVATVVGAVASLVGTVVGSFFGVQVGAVGKERSDAERERSERGIKAALSMLPPEAAEQLRAEMNR
jgi:Beta-lactamase superfamily domain